MEKKRYAFLDIDGVISGWYGNLLNPEKVQLLNQLEGTEIVISSSWGEDDGRTEQRLRENGLTLPIVGYTTHYSRQYDWICRGNEIEEWIIKNLKGGLGTKFGEKYRNLNYEYVIIDDDEDFLYGQRDHLVITNAEVGLTQEDIDKAKKILKIDESNIS